MRLRTVSLVALVLVVVILMSFMFRRSKEIDFDELYNRCDKLKPGMSRDEVLGAMGAPKNISYNHTDSTVREYWYYDDRVLLSTPLRCEFDSTTGILTDALCGEEEERRLYQNRNNGK